MNNLLKNNDIFNDIINEIKSTSSNIIGLTDTAKSFVIANISNILNKPSIVICSNNMEAKKFLNDIKFFTNIETVFFPARDIIYHSIEAENRDNENQRMHVINNILKNNKMIIVTTIDSVVQNILSKENYLNSSLVFKENEDININNVLTTLIKLGYERYPNVEGKGQFSIRGGIIDIFGIDKDMPVRIELFGDTIDTIRTFDTTSQRSIDKIKEYDLSIAKEFSISEDKVNEVINKLELLKEDKNISNELKLTLDKDISTLHLREENTVIDKYFKLFFNNTSTILDYLAGYNVFLNEPSKCLEKLEYVKYEQEETIKILAEKNHLYIPFTNTSLTFNDIEKSILRTTNIYFKTINIQDDISSKRSDIFLDAKEKLFFKRDIENTVNEIKNKYNTKDKINTSTIFVFPTEIRINQMINIFKENNIVVKKIDNILKEEIKQRNIYVTEGTITSGFSIEKLGLDIIAEPVSGTINKSRKINKKNSLGENINSFEDLKIGDYVVHESHGIGIYQGIHSVDIDRITKDYIKIEYDKRANIFVEIDNIDKVKKYVCDDDKPPVINHLGTKDWIRARAKAKAHIEEIAKELILLYAKRNEARGYAFSPDTPFGREFEDTFQYELTDDQEISINEIKEDMEDIKPMDRLLCGDVGFGKTEVALRAAFKAIMDHKQVAYLVPTTVLSLQQFNLFKDRMESFGINVEMLSRFRSKKQQTSILKDLKEGRIDVVIGTHRILSKDVEFKDLGLLVIDEEHRFGVKAKEKIKEYKENIDVLSMTATPIPRTLHMSMIGIRGISTLTTAPLERMPVHTYVLGYEENVIKNAIEKELSRDGQVFYVSNRVGNIEQIASKVKMLVPDARVEYAHGQMTPKQIEDVMMKFINHEIDIIVCTTILESGIDIPNANTIIVENADRLGLAALYQIRGRVGRSSRLAYAYITYDKNKQVSEVASKRLKAIKDFTEFGSGYKIAMRDLEIRGAGNLLGKAQSGHMASIGYELYLSMLERALKEASGANINETEAIAREVKLNIGVSAYIPDSYIKDSSVKVAMYHKISEAHTSDEVLEIVDELLDRFGDLPKSVDNLIKVVEIRNMCRSLNITKVTVSDNNVIFESKDYSNKLKYAITSRDRLIFIQMVLKELIKNQK